MDTSDYQITTRREVVPWQLTEVPHRLLPGLLSYADVRNQEVNER